MLKLASFRVMDLKKANMSSAKGKNETGPMSPRCDSPGPVGPHKVYVVLP